MEEVVCKYRINKTLHSIVLGKKKKKQAESITHIYLHASVSFHLVYIHLHTYI